MKNGDLWKLKIAENYMGERLLLQLQANGELEITAEERLRILSDFMADWGAKVIWMMEDLKYLE